MKRIFALSGMLLLMQVSFSQITNVRKWRISEKDSLDNALLLVEENLHLMALPIFENILANHPNEEFIQYSYAKCALYRPDKHEDAYKYLSVIYTKNKKVEEIDYDVARAAHYSNKLDDAMAAIDHYLAKKRLSPESKIKGEMLKRYITYAQYWTAKPTAAAISNLGEPVNSEADEDAPAITADEATLLFTYTGIKSLGGLMNDLSQPDPQGIYHEDIYLSRRQNGEFKPAAAMDNLNTEGNEASVSLSNDGSILYMFRDNSDDHGDLYESHLEGAAYTSPTKLKGLVNSYSWDGHCSLSPDGKTLYFSSERGGGYGGKDIYKATLLPDSTWGNIVNLGDSINTVYDDDAPFIHADGVTLYFSSKGRSSMGGYDIFRSVMNPADSLFKSTENLGSPINTAEDDVYFVVAANNKTAYYSAGRAAGKGLKDIYKIDPAFTNKAALYLVKGNVKMDSVPTAAAITVEMTSRNNAVYKTLTSNSATGAYLVCLPAGANYKLTYNLAGQTPQTLNIDAQTIADYNEKVYDVKFASAAAQPLASTGGTTSAGSATAAATGTDAATAGVKDSVSASSNSIAVIVPKNTGTGGDEEVSPSKNKTKDNFVPQTKYQEKLMRYVDKYGDIKADSLEFKVQIGAFKNPDNIIYPNLKGYGKLQKLPTEEGLTRIVIGGYFKTLRKAFELNKKIISAGQSDAFVMLTYKGKRVTLEELESLGIFK